MSWLILAFAGCFLIGYFVTTRCFRKRMETGLQCHCEFSSDEIFAEFKALSLEEEQLMKEILG